MGIIGNLLDIISGIFSSRKKGGFSIFKFFLSIILAFVIGSLVFLLKLHFIDHRDRLFDLSVLKNGAMLKRAIPYYIVSFFIIFIGLVRRFNRRERRLLNTSKRYTRNYTKKTMGRMRRVDAKMMRRAEKAARKRAKKGRKKLRYAMDNMSGDMEDNRFMTEQERNSVFLSTDYAALSRVRQDGFPVYAEYKPQTRTVMFNIMQPNHCMVIGSTGSGKTTMVVNPTIQALGAMASHPSMIILDPKGELFAGHSDMLKSGGYNVIHINLREPLRSSKWNPLQGIHDRYREYDRICHDIFERQDDVSDSGLKLAADASRYKKVWYEFMGVAYPDAKSALDQVEGVLARLFDDIYSELDSVLSIISPVEATGDSVTDKNAYTLVEAIALALLEDEMGVMDEFSLGEIFRTLSGVCASEEGVRGFFSSRDEDSRAKSHANMLMGLSDDRLSDCIAKAHEKLSVFNDESLCAMTKKTDVSISSLSTRPTAVFICAADENPDRVALGKVLLTCMYRNLAHIADSSDTLALSRNVYFILDEFGNLPAVDGFERFITKSRSRRMYFMLVIQSFAQLTDKYGTGAAETIKSNCSTKYFLGSNDTATCEEFSLLCGNTTFAREDISGDFEMGTMQVNRSLDTRRLIAPSELMRLNTVTNMGNVIIVSLGNYPIRSRMTPSYQCPRYDMGFGAAAVQKKKTGAGVFALGVLFASALVSAVYHTDVYATDLSYEGELLIDSLYPAEAGDDESDALVPITNDMFYDEGRDEYVYRVCDGAGEVRSNLPEGIMIRESAAFYPDKNVDLTIYRDGEKLTDPNLGNIWEPGDYTVEAFCGSSREDMMSFTLLPQSTGRYSLYRAPMGYVIAKSKCDGEDIDHEKNRMSLDNEGDYLIKIKSKKLKKAYVVTFRVDTTPPRISFSGIDENGVAKKGAVGIEAYDKKDDITVKKDGQPCDFSPAGFSETGAYEVTATDVAGNTTKYEFTIMAYYGNRVRSFLLILLAIVLGIAVYLILERRRFRVR